VAVLAISEKLGSVQKIKVCDIGRIDFLVTELDHAHPRLAPYRKPGIEIL
jgi:DeoR/GlpR family transcriptional regulator of sugar metabolism